LTVALLGADAGKVKKRVTVIRLTAKRQATLPRQLCGLDTSVVLAPGQGPDLVPPPASSARAAYLPEVAHRPLVGAGGEEGVGLQRRRHAALALSG
jgi:hypothetical protein